MFMQSQAVWTALTYQALKIVSVGVLIPEFVKFTWSEVKKGKKKIKLAEEIVKMNKFWSVYDYQNPYLEVFWIQKSKPR